MFASHQEKSSSLASHLGLPQFAQTVFGCLGKTSCTERPGPLCLMFVSPHRPSYSECAE